MKRKGFTIVEVMMVTGISAFIFTGVLSAYMFLGRGLMKLGGSSEMEQFARTAIHRFQFDVEVSSGLASSPSTTSFTINTPIYLSYAAGDQPVAVIGTATYTYVPASGYTLGMLTMIRRSPVATAALQNKLWPTQDYGISDAPVTILKGITSLTFGYYSMGGVATTSTAAVKGISMTASMLSPVPLPGANTFNAAASRATFPSGVIMMRNKTYLSDPNSP